QEYAELRASGHPWMLVVTPDPNTAIECLGRVEVPGLACPVALGWNLAGGHRVLVGDKALVSLGETVNKPFPLLVGAQSLPAGSVLFMHVPSSEFWRSDICVSAILNLREPFKATNRSLVLVASPGAGDRLPPQLAEDVPILVEPLPNESQLVELIETVTSLNEVSCPGDSVARAAANLRGMTRFAAENALARKCLTETLRADELAEVRRASIEESSGGALRFEREKFTFADVGGLGALRRYMERVFAGPDAPDIIVRIDEIDKVVSAAATGAVADNTGVSQDMLRTLLTAIEDNGWVLQLLTGIPGCLSGDTVIHDPVDGSNLPVRNRWQAGAPFHVWAMGEAGPVVTAACPPKKYAPAQMAAVHVEGLDSPMMVTMGHRFWTTESWRTCAEVYGCLRESVEVRLPSSGDTSLQARASGGLRWSEMTGPPIDWRPASFPGRLANCRSAPCPGRYAFPPGEATTRRVVRVELLNSEPYYDFHVPLYENYWAGGLWHHNCGKTLATIATGNTFERTTLAADFGRCRGSLVGQSEAAVRRMIDVVTALGGRKVLVTATANRMDTLPPELLSRAGAGGIWFFDVPDETERAAIWRIQREKYGIADGVLPSDDLWVGRDIRNCCRTARMLGVGLKEAATYTMVTGVVSQELVAQSRYLAATSGYLSVRVPGRYLPPGALDLEALRTVAAGARKIVPLGGGSVGES
ncbi:MAG: hypothetical protein QME96_10715, partial [Myxococcota bacterium]|nr:hypothetical protein [Myxococcota bacterium]